MSPAAPRLYFENPAARLLEHPDGYAIFQYHPGKRKFSDLQAVLTHTGQLLARNGWHKILGDQRLMTPFTNEENAWIVNHWFTTVRQRPDGSDIYAAVLLANDVFARLAANQIVHEAQGTIAYKLFDDAAQATAWLRQLP